MNFTRIGILFFASAALAGPWYTVDGYSTVSNLISQLGAQKTQNNWIMVIGFLSLGCGIIVDSIRRLSRRVLPFAAFGMFMALAGIFAHKPLSPVIQYNEFAHQAHSVLATLAGVSITVGLLWYAVAAASLRSRVTAIALAGLCLALPLCMLVFPDFQGLIQRLKYLLLFSWLWICFPFEINSDR